MNIQEMIHAAPLDMEFARENCIRGAQAGLMAEFGVQHGRYMKEMARMAFPRLFYGFDSFKGLPEDWTGTNNRKGAFACDVPNNLPPNVELVIGLFQDTLPAFLDKHREKFGFIHMDADLYSSTKYVLDTIRPWIDGAYVMFDQITREDYCQQHEGRAMQEWSDENPQFKIECIAQQKRDGAIFKITK